MTDKKDKPKYLLVQHGRQTRVVERQTDLVIRTLDTRTEAADFLAQLDPPKKEKRHG